MASVTLDYDGIGLVVTSDDNNETADKFWNELIDEFKDELTAVMISLNEEDE